MGTTYTARAHDLGHGHLELSAVRDTAWQELDWTENQVRDHFEMLAALEVDEEYQAERARVNLERACKRAKTRVRRLCKAMGVDTLLTLTYRANETDLSRAKADLKAFNRRMVQVLPNFRFVATFERQDRGAWHMHMGTAGIPAFFMIKGTRVKSYDLLRNVWRSVTGDRGGTCNLSRHGQNGSSAAQIAKYIASYMTKTFEAIGAGTNRFAAYGVSVVPKPLNFGSFPSALDAVQVCYTLLGDGRVVDQLFSRFGDWFFVHAEGVT